MRSFYTFYFDATKIAIQSIFAHKLRAFLTLIGIIIGVASVVVVGASINGLNTYVMDKVTKILGVNHFMIARFARVTSEEEWERQLKRNKRLYWDDYEWLRDHCQSCQHVGAQVQSGTDIKQGGEEVYGTMLAGVTSNMAEIEDKTIAEGRFILPHEVDGSALVCVIGMDLREKFFPGVDPIGKTIKLVEIPMRIVGVEEKRGSMFGQSLDNHAYVPLTTFAKMFGRRQSLQLHGKASNREEFEAAVEEARVALRSYHKIKGHEEDDFGMVNTEMVSSEVDGITGAIAGVIMPITIISLVVGGIVVMNIMLVSVTERTFEVGLRKAVGARRSHILLQFLIESAILTSLGGAIGLGLAAVLAWLVGATTPIPMTITIFYMVLSVGISGLIGIIAGIYPAFKAARLDPIAALAKN
jgi:putative ABC transport system permease protein